FTNKVIPCGDDRDLVGLLPNSDGTPFAAVRPEDIAGRPELYALSNIPPPVTTQTVPATDYALTANSTSFKLSSPGPGVIVLTDNNVSKVVVFDNFSSGRQSFLPDGEQSRLMVVRDDLKKLEAVKEAMNGCDTVFHLAANPDIAKAVSFPDIDFWEGTYLTQ